MEATETFFTNVLPQLGALGVSAFTLITEDRKVVDELDLKVHVGVAFAAVVYLMAMMTQKGRRLLKGSMIPLCVTLVIAVVLGVWTWKDSTDKNIRLINGVSAGVSALCIILGVLFALQNGGMPWINF
jgi:hypothetical protein